VRSIRILEVSDLDRPGVKKLIAAARKRADPPLTGKAKRRVIVRQSRKP
jgi:hypothetical protein